MANQSVEKKLAEIKRQLESSYEETKRKIEEEDRYSIDERILRLDVGQTKVRILPPLKGHSLPWIKKYIHMFVSMSTGKLVAFDCPTSDNKQCKICNFNRKLWESGTEHDIAMARKFKRRAAYICNVYVKNNPANTEDNGSVKVFRFGTKVHDKLVASLDEGIVGMYYDPTDGGADFIIVKKIVKSGKNEWANYDDSTFIKGEPLHDEPKEVLKILEDAYELNEFAAKYDENDIDLAKAFQVHVLAQDENNKDSSVDEVADQASETEETKPEIINIRDEIKKDEPEVKEQQVKAKETSEETSEDTTDDDFLNNLMDELDNVDD